MSTHSLFSILASWIHPLNDDFNVGVWFKSWFEALLDGFTQIRSASSSGNHDQYMRHPKSDVSKRKIPIHAGAMSNRHHVHHAGHGSTYVNIITIPRKVWFKMKQNMKKPDQGSMALIGFDDFDAWGSWTNGCPPDLIRWREDPHFWWTPGPSWA